MKDFRSRETLLRLKLSVSILWLLGGVSFFHAQTTPPLQNDSLWVVRFIHIEGNRLTKAHIIKRELPLQEGDTIHAAQITEICKQVSENLMNTGLFNFTDAHIVQDSTLHTADLVIKLTEQWYFFIFPQITFADRNVNTWMKEHKLSELSLGPDTWLYNFRGRRETLRIFPMFGYDRQMMVDYDIPFVTKKMKWGLFMGGHAKTSHSILYSVTDNRSVFSPKFTNHAQSAHALHLGVRYRHKIHISHSAKLQFEQHILNDSIATLNPLYLGDSISSSKNLSLSYLLKIDHRNYATYPLLGYYFDVEGKYMLIFHDMQLRKSLVWLRSTFRKYRQLTPRLYYAFAITGFSCNNAAYPFHLQENSLGFGRFYVRGYEKYLFKTQHYLLGKQNIKFALLKDYVFRLFGIKNDTFGKVPLSIFLTMFSDAALYNDQYFSPTEDFDKSLIFSFGIGLDIVTYYERVLRIEFTCNRRNERGIYFSFFEPL